MIGKRMRRALGPLRRLARDPRFLSETIGKMDALDRIRRGWDEPGRAIPVPCEETAASRLAAVLLDLASPAVCLARPATMTGRRFARCVAVDPLLRLATRTPLDRLDLRSLEGPTGLLHLFDVLLELPKDIEIVAAGRDADDVLHGRWRLLLTSPRLPAAFDCGRDRDLARKPAFAANLEYQTVRRHSGPARRLLKCVREAVSDARRGLGGDVEEYECAFYRMADAATDATLIAAANDVANASFEFSAGIDSV